MKKRLSNLLLMAVPDPSKPLGELTQAWMTKEEAKEVQGVFFRFKKLKAGIHYKEGTEC